MSTIHTKFRQLLINLSNTLEERLLFPSYIFKNSPAHTRDLVCVHFKPPTEMFLWLVTHSSPINERLWGRKDCVTGLAKERLRRRIQGVHYVEL